MYIFLLRKVMDIDKKHHYNQCVRTSGLNNFVMQFKSRACQKRRVQVEFIIAIQLHSANPILSV